MLKRLESWAEQLPEIVKGYGLKDIWNADETGLFWCALPDKSLSVKKGRCKGGKYAKQRITVLLTVNALGEKEPPIIIGRSLTPRCFKNVKDKRRPCGPYYYANKKAVDSYLNQDEDAVTSVDTVDIHSMNWWEDMMEKAIRFAIEGDDETEKQAEADDDFDIERSELKIRSSQAALSTADDLNNFCETLGDAELVSALSLVTRRLETLRLKNVSQKKVTDYFNKTL